MCTIFSRRASFNLMLGWLRGLLSVTCKDWFKCLMALPGELGYQCSSIRVRKDLLYHNTLH